MKVSRISFPESSPNQPESAGRTYLDMVAGVLNVVTTDGSAPIGPLTVANVTAANTNVTPASGPGKYYRVSNGSANTLTITDADYLVGSVIKVKNVGAGTCTITGSGNTTIIGTAAITTGQAVDIVCILAPDATDSTWEILAYA